MWTATALSLAIALEVEVFGSNHKAVVVSVDAQQTVWYYIQTQRKYVGSRFVGVSVSLRYYMHFPSSGSDCLLREWYDQWPHRETDNR